MQDIANRAGVTKATVSLALRSHPSIPETTRLRIEEMARTMGYRPNPLISVLMAHLRTGTPDQCSSTIAYVTHATPEMMKNIPAAGRYFAGAERRADEFGCSLECFRYTAGTDGRALGRVLIARGIRGVLIAPGSQPGFTLNFPWSHFCLATLGYTLKEPALNRSINHQYHTIRLAFQKAVERGGQRIMLLVNRADDAKTEHLWSGGFFACQQAMPVSARVPFRYLDEQSPADLKRTLARYRPDVALTIRDPQRWEPLRAAGLEPFRDIELLLLDRSDDPLEPSGVNQRSDLVGSVGIELVVQNLMTNSFGIPDNEKIVLTEGRWVEAPRPVVRLQKGESSPRKTTQPARKKPARLLK